MFIGDTPQPECGKVDTDSALNIPDLSTSDDESNAAPVDEGGFMFVPFDPFAPLEGDNKLSTIDEVDLCREPPKLLVRVVK